MSKVIWALSCFSFLCCVLVPENLYHPLNQLDSKPKAMSVSIVLDFTLHSDWLFVIFSFLLIGCFNHFGFCFVTVKGKALCCTTYEIYTSIFFILLLTPPSLLYLMSVFRLNDGGRGGQSHPVHCLHAFNSARLCSNSA